MSPLTPALINYWQRLPIDSLAARRRSLDATRDRVCAGLEPAAALLPFAIGDVDDGIVVAATHSYVRAATASQSVADAAEWIRRGLALNRGAVFGALLSLDDPQAVERLAALRLLLSAAEVETACRVAGSAPCATALAFLRDWADLIAHGPLQRERLALQSVMSTDGCAQAA